VSALFFSNFHHLFDLNAHVVSLSSNAAVTATLAATEALSDKAP
jgi:hypothetical protein